MKERVDGGSKIWREKGDGILRYRGKGIIKIWRKRKH